MNSHQNSETYYIGLQGNVITYGEGIELGGTAFRQTEIPSRSFMKKFHINQCYYWPSLITKCKFTHL